MQSKRLRESIQYPLQTESSPKTS